MEIERFVERVLFASRWLLLPLYLGLALLLVLFAVHFFRELYHIAAHALAMDDKEMIVGALSLIDLTLIAGLVIMVMLSGYENFISRMDLPAAQSSIAWLGKLDSGALKLKVAASLVAISAVQLLKWYMDIDQVPADKLLWMVVIQLTFVATALLLTVMDRLLGHNHAE